MFSGWCLTVLCLYIHFLLFCLLTPYYIVFLCHTLKSQKCCITGARDFKTAVENGSIEDLNFLIESGDCNCEAALCQASEKGSLNIVQYLVENKADIESKTGDRKKTAFHLASQNGHVDIVRFLLENKADIETRDEYKQTALHLGKFINNIMQCGPQRPIL